MIRKSWTVGVLLAAFILVVAGVDVMSSESAPASRTMTRPERETLNRLKDEAASHGIVFTPSGLVAGLSHKEPAVRALCLAGLAKIGDLTVVEPMGKLMDDPEWMVRMSAVRAIADLVSEKTTTCAEKLYEESANNQDRFGASVLLCCIGDPSRYKDVLAVVRNPKDPLLNQALYWVPVFSKYHLYEGGKPVDWAEPVTQILMDEKATPISKQAAASALAGMHSPAALTALEQALPTVTDQTVQYIIKNALATKGEDEY